MTTTFKCQLRYTLLGQLLLCLALSANLVRAESRNVGDGPVDVTFLGHSTGGQASVFLAGVVEAVRRTYPGSNVYAEPGNAAGNLASLLNGRGAYTMVSEVSLKRAFEGQAPFQQKFPPGSLTAIGKNAPNIIATCVYGRKKFLDEHNVDSFSDLVENEVPMRLSIAQTGNLWVRSTVDAMFSYFDKTTKDVERWGGKLAPVPTSPSNDLMRDGRLDVIITACGLPSGSITELASVQEINFIPMSRELAEHVADEMWSTVDTIPAGTYPFYDQDLIVPFSSFVIVAGSEATYDNAYKIAKSLYEQNEYYRSFHRSLANAEREELPDVGNLELHPGAEAFYREVGLLD
ncbi:TAXI family TRAP transporter solute-binding subunit [Marinobacter sp. TBZ242]|uniref:TAXI family TRAP transporter solute-binding subunit n=1 Tax=Marinobacter azerbaijanicus TaxID=3050455 RepID=A0ABT7IGC4_9GAMM|nr:MULTISPECIES: TAXI family TRAP transporter solute-binding subunit [Marinobacter]MBJ7275788.1 TAXI family TRAP transporter solute-binding subunit [Marinobacter salarius]MBL3559000.1 TAXI family TRAP transporter solute-binding subunit [Marinobacter sp. JB05H06]MDL0433223.1 TAXI family TRAP transporter solute-binding subunit [Marinobacter sp. TBZ242]